MPYDRSPKKKRAHSTPTKHRDESDDEFEDIGEESYSSEYVLMEIGLFHSVNESDMLIEEEEEHVFSSSEDEQPKYVRSSRRCILYCFWN